MSKTNYQTSFEETQYCFLSRPQQDKEIFKIDLLFDLNEGYVLENGEKTNIKEFIDNQLEEAYQDAIHDKNNAKIKNKLIKHYNYKEVDNSDLFSITFKTSFRPGVTTTDNYTLYKELEGVEPGDEQDIKLKDPLVGNGSIGRVIFNVVPYVHKANKWVGISLYLKRVQFKQILPYKGADFNKDKHQEENSRIRS
jgi:hypothetical protein